MDIYSPLADATAIEYNYKLAIQLKRNFLKLKK